MGDACMTITFKTKLFGDQKIDMSSAEPWMMSRQTAIWKAVEYMFDKWFEKNTAKGAPMRKDIMGMYHGEIGQPATQSREGAIEEGIAIFFQQVEQQKEKTIFTTVDLQEMDIESAFQ
jgi:hypothetical protein